MRKRNIYRNSISRITRSAVLLAAALPALLLPSGCERENLLKEIAGDEAVMRFSVSESVPELLTKSHAADRRETTEENVIVLTSADGRTLRLIAEEEPLTSSRPASAEATAAVQAPATKAAKIYSQSASLADNETFAVWAYNIAATASSFYDWKLDIGLPKSGSVLVPAQATKDGSYWKPSPDIQYNTEKLNAHRTRWFALAPWGAYRSEDLTLNHVPVSMGTTLPMAYTIPSGQAVDQQWDLLAATTSPRVAEETTPVDLKFVHVLTGIRFKRDKDLNISNITVSGVYNSATLDLLKLPQTPQPLSSGSAPSLSEYTNVDGTSTSDATKDLWSNRTKSVTAPATEPSWTMDMSASGTWTNGNPKDNTQETQYDYAKEDANILMMIPQLTPQGAKITVTIGGIEYTGDISGHRWLPGRLVTYRINEPSYFKVTLVSLNKTVSPAAIATFTGATTTEAPGGGVVADGGVIECNGYNQSFTFSVASSEDLGFDVAEVEISPGVATSHHSPSQVSPWSVTVSISHNNDLGNRDPGLTQFLPFSISAAKKVTFSPGNLQYRASTGTWRFAQRQWDYVGGTVSGVQNYGTVYEDGVKSDNTLIAQDYVGWIDLFGRGTTGYNYKNLSSTEYQPWSNSNVDGNYGPNSDLTRDGDKPSDWGANMGEGYYTLSCPWSQTQTGEWYYLIVTRTTTYPDNCSYLKAQIMPADGVYREMTITFRAKNDPSYAVRYTVRQTPLPVPGLLLFPDGFPKTDSRVSSYSNINQRNVGWTQLPWDSWLSLQSSGCVFLPAAGRRQSTDPPQMVGLNLNPNGEVVGAYWSRSSGNGSNVSNLWIHPSQLGFSSMAKSFGHSVRLVRDIQYKLVFTDLTDANIPQSLKDAGYTTAEAIKNALREHLRTVKGDQYVNNCTYHNAELWVSYDGGTTWSRTTVYDLPAEGFESSLVYRTSRNTHQFAVSHMITTSQSSLQPGEIYTPAVTCAAEGIQFIFHDIQGPLVISHIIDSGSTPGGGGSGTGTGTGTGSGSQP